jgi:hypothetical protein
MTPARAAHPREQSQANSACSAIRDAAVLTMLRAILRVVQGQYPSASTSCGVKHRPRWTGASGGSHWGAAGSVRCSASPCGAAELVLVGHASTTPAQAPDARSASHQATSWSRLQEGGAALRGLAAQGVVASWHAPEGVILDSAEQCCRSKVRAPAQHGVPTGPPTPLSPSHPMRASLGLLCTHPLKSSSAPARISMAKVCKSHGSAQMHRPEPQCEQTLWHQRGHCHQSRT